MMFAVTRELGRPASNWILPEASFAPPVAKDEISFGAYGKASPTTQESPSKATLIVVFMRVSDQFVSTKHATHE